MTLKIYVVDTDVWDAMDHAGYISTNGYFTTMDKAVECLHSVDASNYISYNIVGDEITPKGERVIKYADGSEAIICAYEVEVY